MLMSVMKMHHEFWPSHLPTPQIRSETAFRMKASLLAVALLLPLLPCAAQEREFTNRDGRTIRAEVLDLKDGTVAIRSMGKTFQIAVSTLSDADQAWLKQWDEERSKPRGPAGRGAGTVPQRASGPFEIKTTFADTESCDHLTGGIYIFWWDKKNDFREQAKTALKTLEDVRKDCLEVYGMSDPPNPLDGYFYNVYIHDSGKDLFPDDWAMGQGTDTNRYPFLTLPAGYCTPGNSGCRHEGFHIFQYRANSPGFAYSGDSQWYIEASANWYAATKNPGSENEYITASAVTANPHLPLWYSFDNKAPGEAKNWQRDCHQYGMNSLLNYLTDVRKVPARIIAGGFYAATKLSPQEYLIQNLGGPEFRDFYADYAVHNVAGFPEFPKGTAERTMKELEQYGDAGDMHPTVFRCGAEGTGPDWYRPEPELTTRGWSYNVYRIDNDSAGTWQFELHGDPAGSEGAPAEFRGRVLVQRGSRKSSVLPLEMKDALNGSAQLRTSSTDKEIYLIVAATPPFFTTNQTYSYQVRIARQ